MSTATATQTPGTEVALIQACKSNDIDDPIFTEYMAKSIIIAITKGEIPHVKIGY
jgi:hypothetical protein